MRKIELRTVDEDIKSLYVDGEYTGLFYTKNELNAMLDDLVATWSSRKPRSRSDLLAELLTRTLADRRTNCTLQEGPMTPEELREVTRIVEKSCKKGWF